VAGAPSGPRTRGRGGRGGRAHPSAAAGTKPPLCGAGHRFVMPTLPQRCPEDAGGTGCTWQAFWSFCSPLSDKACKPDRFRGQQVESVSFLGHQPSPGPWPRYSQGSELRSDPMPFPRPPHLPKLDLRVENANAASLSQHPAAHRHRTVPWDPFVPSPICLLLLLISPCNGLATPQSPAGLPCHRGSSPTLICIFTSYVVLSSTASLSQHKCP
jgi:hypothetical protein